MADETTQTTDDQGIQPAPGEATETTSPPVASDQARTFTQADIDRAVGERLARQSQSLERELGMPIKDARAALAAQREREEAQKSDAQRATERAAELERANAELQAEKLALKRQAEFERAARQADIAEDRLDDAYKLATFPADDDADYEAVVKTLVEGRPWLRGAVLQPMTGASDGNVMGAMSGAQREERRKSALSKMGLG